MRRLKAKYLAQTIPPPIPLSESLPGMAFVSMDMDMDQLNSAESNQSNERLDHPDNDQSDDECYPSDMAYLFNDMVAHDTDSDEEEDESDSEDEEVGELGQFLSGLRLWVVETSQTITATDRLLRLLSDKFPSAKSIPRTHKTLMGTPKMTLSIRPCSPGVMAYFGIEEHLMTITDPAVLARDVVSIIVGSGGAPLADSSARQTIPLMGYICDSDLPVFGIGNYIGMKKPESACDYLKEYTEEKVRLERDVFGLALIRSSRSSV